MLVCIICKLCTSGALGMESDMLLREDCNMLKCHKTPYMFDEALDTLLWTEHGERVAMCG